MNVAMELNGNLGNSDEELFRVLNTEVVGRKLFLNSDLSRGDLLRLIRVPKNRISRVIAQGAGANLAGYINGLRIEYAARLLVEHPNYTVNAIAQEAGILNVSSFHRIFKARYGTTPAIYRQRNVT